MSTNKQPGFLFISVLAILMINLFFLSDSFGQPIDPNPKVLLKGLEIARHSMISGRIECTINCTQPPNVPQHPQSLILDFDGVKITSTLAKRVVVLAKKTDANTKTLAAMNYDEEAFVKAGYGEFRNEKIHYAWDGITMARNGKQLQPSIIQSNQTMPDYFFDPRIIGIAPAYGFTETVGNNLNTDHEAEYTLIGSEMRQGKAVYHVRSQSIKNPQWTADIWLEAEGYFRIHQAIYPNGYSKTLVTSEYKADPKYGPLPYRVVATDYDKDNVTIRQKFEITINAADINVPVDPKVGTLASLEIPPGRQVNDQTTKLRAGYWDGDKLVQERIPGQSENSDRAQTPEKISYKNGLIIALFFLSIFGWIMYRRYRIANK